MAVISYHNMFLIFYGILTFLNNKSCKYVLCFNIDRRITTYEFLMILLVFFHSDGFILNPARTKLTVKSSNQSNF